MNKLMITSLLVTILSIGGIIFLLRGKPSTDTPVSQTNVQTVDGKQMIQITAKGGYLPRATTARANVPTVIQVNTNGTYDCSAALAIPSLGIRKMLPPSGATSIDIPPQPPGTVLRAACAMGMYYFTVNFN